jgi:PEGA domain
VPRARAPRPGQTYYAPSYSRRYYTGVGGLGYYFYDPWSWYGGPGYGAFGWNGYFGNNWGGYYGNNWGGYYGGGFGGFGGGYGAYGGPFGWSIGGVRMKVSPKDAEVYVDGYYAGIVDDFDGMWQQLRLDEGGYQIEVRKPGLTTLTFDVMVQPGRTITYRGRMQP